MSPRRAVPRNPLRFLASLIAVAALTASTGAAPASAAVTYVTQWGSGGSGEGQFGGPVGLAASPSGAVFVSDIFNNQSPHIQAFTSTGGFLLRWAPGLR